MTRGVFRDMTASHSFLIVRPDAIGDAVLLAPMLFTLKKAFPNCKITLLLQTYTEPLYRSHPCVDEILLHDPSRSLMETVACVKAGQFDYVFMPYFEFYYAFVMWLAGVPHRIADGQKVGLRWFLTHPVSLNLRDVMQHEIDLNIRLVLGVFPDVEPVRQINSTSDEGGLPRSFLVADDLLWRTDVVPLLASLGVEEHDPYIIVHPTTGGGNRAWDPQYYRQFIVQFCAQQSGVVPHVLVTGFGACDADIATRICKGTSAINMVNRTDLSGLMALIKHAQVVIGTDTGPTHIAAALQVPVVGVTPTKFVKALRWGPYHTPNIILNQSYGCTLACNPYQCTQTYCLDAIPVLSLVKSVQEMLLSSERFYDEHHFNWIVSSLVMGVVMPSVTDSESEKALIRFFEEKNINYVVFVPSQSVADELAASDWGRHQSVCVASGLRALRRYVVSYDVTVVFDFKSTFSSWVFGMVRQLSAINMYVPPIRIQSECELTESGMVDVLKKTFSR